LSSFPWTCSDFLAGAEEVQGQRALEGVVFEDDSGNQATLPEETIKEVIVGWFVG
jgi:hypothetical protein